MTPFEVTLYYANLLIVQYRQKPNAYATIQTWVTPVIQPQVTSQEIDFSGVAVGGVFVVSYLGSNSPSINWNDSVSTIQTKLQTVPGLSAVTVTGSINTQILTVTFTGVFGIGAPLVVVSSSLVDSDSDLIAITITETDVTLPIAIQNAYNVLAGTQIAQGVQLDVLGKYAGVSRQGNGLQGQPILLDDADFWSLIRFATILNSAQSDLNTIQNLVENFFSGNLFVFDFQNMHMGYMIDSSLGTADFAEMIVTQGLLPRPMGVQLASVIYAPHIANFFGFRTYFWGTYKNKPFNSYIAYDETWTWLSYSDALVIGSFA
jgi:hypothetical protein